MSKFTVSVFMLTYNQEQFIAQAIEGVLMQKTTFHYQLVIGEDSSNDDTRRICEEYAAANPEKIKLLPSYKNLGLINNFIRTYQECNGKYVAICDGDDYWTDPLKLQKQIDFLENSPGYSLVFTSFNFLFPDGRLVEKDYNTQKEDTGFEDLIFQNYICSATALFRNKKAPDDFPGWLEQCPYGDWPLYLWTTRKGERIKYMDDLTAVYRREIGVSEKMKLVPSKIAFENLNIIQQISNDPNFHYHLSIVKKSLKKHQLQLMGCYLREKQLQKLIPITLSNLTFSPVKVCKAYLYRLKSYL